MQAELRDSARGGETPTDGPRREPCPALGRKERTDSSHTGSGGGRGSSGEGHWVSRPDAAHPDLQAGILGGGRKSDQAGTNQSQAPSGGFCAL